MREKITALAVELGISEIGFAAPEPTTWHSYQAWIQNGYHGEMAYLQKRMAERKDPSLLLPGVQTAILVACAYRKNPAESTPEYLTGTIANYAQNDDYHEVLRHPLESICQLIETETQHKTRIFIDSSPVMETDIASRTHIGWKGKNTVLVNKKLGQYFLIGGILTTLPLEFDEPHANLCGSCTRCIDACPTHAFISPYILDARQCISYWTIEQKGMIPEPMRHQIGTRLFGCDDCIAVCPWNRFLQPAVTHFFNKRDSLALPHLLEWMKMSPATFRELFSGTPIFRLKRRRLLRNIAVVLGNIGDPKAIPVLQDSLKENDDLISIHAEWALDKIANKQKASSQDEAFCE